MTIKKYKSKNLKVEALITNKGIIFVGKNKKVNFIGTWKPSEHGSIRKVRTKKKR